MNFHRQPGNREKPKAHRPVFWQCTLNTPGCPSGYYNVWSTLEQGGSAPGGNSITVYLPQTVKLRCFKNDNSWTSDEKPFTIASAIPDDIKVTSNSPVVSGGTALLTGTSISGATYLWTPPAGVTLPALNNRILQIPNVTTTYSGEYKLKVSSGGCEVEVSSRVDVDLCDNLYIKAFDPANGEEKTRLTRKPGQLNLYDDLVLQVETFEGEILKGVEYTWTMPQGVTAGQDPAQKHKITINKIGNYKVNVTSAGGVSCPLEVDISALACATPADFLTCGSSSTVTSTGTEKLKNLAVGDVFSTYDYVVSVTEVSGSEMSGWTGKGFIEMSFLKLGATALSVPLAVRFDNIHLNQCYQLLPGSKVITEFDENWSNMVDVDLITDRLSAVYAEIKDLLATNPDDKQALQKKVDELNTIKTDLATSGFRPDWITRQTTALDGVIDGTSCLINSANLRSTNSCSPSDVVMGVNNAESVAKIKECHETIRGISPWTITFEENGKDYLNDIKDGQLAHFMIEYYYTKIHPSAYREYAIPESSYKGNTGYADIVNPTTSEIFEIKPRGNEAIGVVEVQRYITKGNLHCKPSSGDWVKGTNFAMPEVIWPRDPTKTLRAQQSTNDGVIIYSIEDNKNNKPELETVPAPSIEQIKQMVKLMVLAGSYAAAENVARTWLKKMPDDVKWKILIGGGAGVVAGVVVSATGAGSGAGISAAVVGVILVNVCYEQLNGTNYGDS